MAYNEDFRALASVAINKDIESTELKSKALAIMLKIVNLMDMTVEIESTQTEKYLSTLKSGIEVIKS
jgi:hypothetical protein